MEYCNIRHTVWIKNRYPEARGIPILGRLLHFVTYGYKIHVAEEYRGIFIQDNGSYNMEYRKTLDLIIYSEMWKIIHINVHPYVHVTLAFKESAQRLACKKTWNSFSLYDAGVQESDSSRDEGLGTVFFLALWVQQTTAGGAAQGPTDPQGGCDSVLHSPTDLNSSAEGQDFGPSSQRHLYWSTTPLCYSVLNTLLFVLPH